MHTDAFNEEILGVEAALEQLIAEFSASLVNEALLAEAVKKSLARSQLKVRRHEEAVYHFSQSMLDPSHSFDPQISSILELSTRANTHVRSASYLQSSPLIPSPPVAICTICLQVSLQPDEERCRRLSQVGQVLCRALHQPAFQYPVHRT